MVDFFIASQFEKLAIVGMNLSEIRSAKSLYFVWLLFQIYNFISLQRIELIKICTNLEIPKNLKMFKKTRTSLWLTTLHYRRLLMMVWRQDSVVWALKVWNAYYFNKYQTCFTHEALDKLNILIMEHIERWLTILSAV